MENNIQNIVIESLFKGDTEILYVELRNRAETVNMPMPDFHTAFTAAVKSGQIEADKFGNVKLRVEDYYPTGVKAKFQFKRSGRKIPNKLCEAVLQQAEGYANVRVSLKDLRDTTIEDIFKSITDYAFLCHDNDARRCKPMKVEWNGYEVKNQFGIWENSEAIWKTASALAYIKVVQED